MSDNKIHILNDNSLVDLNNTLEYTADSLLKIEEAVDKYMTGVIDTLNQQMEILRKRLAQAQEKLAAAEADLSSCEASQTWDEEDECWHPSCDAEAAAVSAAEEEVRECQQNVDKGEEILSRCQTEYDTYHEPVSFLYPPGGHYLIDYAAHNFTDAATQTMRQLIEAVGRYRQFHFNGSSGQETANADNNQPNAQEDEQKRKNALEEIKGNQSYVNPDANRVMVCPKCGRPLSMCSCSANRDMVIIK